MTKILPLLFLFLFSIAPLSRAATLINGAGASFPYPLYSKWFAEYQKIRPDVQINYQSIGSGGGIKQLLEKTVDFGASDAPMTEEQLSKATVPVVHIPTVLGAVVITYNLPETTAAIRLSPEVLSEIFLGSITKWNDDKLKKLNPSLALPSTPILVVHRSDGSGTTNVFTDYLAKVSPKWKEKVGAGTSVNWPVGLGGKGNDGVTGLIKQTPGSIGYVELVYAETNKLPVATLKNQTGAFVAPSVKSVTAAASAFSKNMPADFRISITNAPGKDAYPLSAFTYLLLYSKMDVQKGKQLIEFVRWALTDGQAMAEPLSYAKLPKDLVKKVEAAVKKIKTE